MKKLQKELKNAIIAIYGRKGFGKTYFENKRKVKTNDKKNNEFRTS